MAGGIKTGVEAMAIEPGINTIIILNLFRVMNKKPWHKDQKQLAEQEFEALAE